jgi:hypothetical protein
MNSSNLPTLTGIRDDIETLMFQTYNNEMKSIIEFICNELNCNDKVEEFIKKFIPNAKNTNKELKNKKTSINYHDNRKIKINTCKNPRKGAPLSRRNIYKDGMTVKEAKKYTISYNKIIKNKQTEITEQIKDTSIKYDLKLEYIIFEPEEDEDEDKDNKDETQNH